jgi:ribulose-phosphate 3-epimerase
VSVICPTVLAAAAEDYREQLEAVAPFASRIQIDLGDGEFTTQSITIDELWWPKDNAIDIDIHLMYRRPVEVIDALVRLKPHMVIIHAEAEGDLLSIISELQRNDILAGIALLQQTQVAEAADLLKSVDHLLIFSGALGSFGGKADLTLLRKVKLARQINPDIEIGWDGGANLETTASLVDGGIDVINVGGAIQKSLHPHNVYRQLVRQLHH